MNPTPPKKERGQRLLNTLQQRREQAASSKHTKRNEQIGMDEETYTRLSNYATDLHIRAIEAYAFNSIRGDSPAMRAFDVIHSVSDEPNKSTALTRFMRLDPGWHTFNRHLCNLRLRRNLTSCWVYFMKCRQTEIKLRLKR